MPPNRHVKEVTRVDAVGMYFTNVSVCQWNWLYYIDILCDFHFMLWILIGVTVLVPELRLCYCSSCRLLLTRNNCIEVKKVDIHFITTQTQTILKHSLKLLCWYQGRKATKNAYFLTVIKETVNDFAINALIKRSTRI